MYWGVGIVAKMAADIKMDELLVRWLSIDGMYESIMKIVETERKKNKQHDVIGSCHGEISVGSPPTPSSMSAAANSNNATSSSLNSIPPKSPQSSSSVIKYQQQQQQRQDADKIDLFSGSSPTNVANYIIPPLVPNNRKKLRQSSSSSSSSLGDSKSSAAAATTTTTTASICSDATSTTNNNSNAIADQSWSTLQQNNATLRKVFTNNDAIVTMNEFTDITKDLCRFPSFFNAPLYRRISLLFHEGGDNINDNNNNSNTNNNVSYHMFQHYWISEMEPFDEQERFFRLVKKLSAEYITRDDFLPFIEELLISHPGLEFLSNHAEFQEKYAVTVITRIFYSVCCRRGGGYNGKITLRQIKRSNLLEAMHMVDAEDDINKVTQYFSYEHFYVLYCRFWELDHDRDYLITREDLIKYGDCSLSHMIVDRIFEAAPRPFERSSIVTEQVTTTTATDATTTTNKTKNTSSTKREHLSYEDFIFFMLSEEDKANEISVRYWFACVDVDGDGKLSTVEMRSFYAMQLHRMQCLGHEIVPFEDMLCQMMDMIKPASQEYFVVEDFLQPECSQVSGALFDALFNLNKYLQFEQRDPFMERQKREDEFECDWDRFACIDYNRLAMEEEAREEEAMEIDWVTADEDDDDGDDFNSLGLGGASEAPF